MYLLSGQGSFHGGGGGLHKRNVAYRDVLLSFREPMMPEEEDEIWVGCIFMLMSNVSSLA